MTRSKAAILAIAALALVATSVFATSGANAIGESKFEFTCLKNHTTHVHCTGDGEEAQRHGSELVNHKWVAGFATVECETTKFNVTTDDNGTSKTAPTEPVYEGCSATGGLPTDVKMNGCHYEFHIEKERTSTEESTGTEYEGSADLNCPAGVTSATVEITYATPHANPKCVIHIPEQNTIKPIYFRNMTGSPTDVTVEAVDAVATTTYTGTGTGNMFEDCGLIEFDGNQHVHGTSKYTGNTTVRATDTEGTFIDSKVN